MLKKTYEIFSKIIGISLMGLAFFQWVTFDYPDVNPFWPGAVFAPGMGSQMINWVIVSLLGGIGWGFFTLWKLKPENRSHEESK